MTSTLHIAAIVGSLRSNSLNRIVFEAAAELLPTDVSLTEARLADVPLYNSDDEDAGDPVGVAELKRIVRDSDGLIIFTPEYNRSIPAVTKNAVDWLSRPHGDGPIVGKPVGIVAGMPGQHRGDGVRAHLADTVGVLTPNLMKPALGLPSVGRAIENGRLIAEDSLAELDNWMKSFVDFLQKPRDT